MRKAKTNWREESVCHQCGKPMDSGSQFKVWATREGFPQGVTRTLCSAVCVDSYMDMPGDDNDGD